jgi:hypothetical protein
VDDRQRLTLAGLIATAEADNPETPPDDVAALIVATAPQNAKDAVLARLLAEEVMNLRRTRVRAIEQEAQRASEREDHLRQLAELDAERREKPWTAARNSRVYQTWATTTEEGRRHEAKRREDKTWREDARQRYLDGGGLGGALARIVDEIKTEAKLELTAELLGSTFALGDGTHVTWGDASTDHHVQRIELLMRNVEGNIQTVRIHEAALNLLRQSGSSCLADVSRAAQP